MRQMDIGEVSAWAGLIAGLAAGFGGIVRWTNGIERSVAHLQRNRAADGQVLAGLDSKTDNILIELAKVQEQIKFIASR